MTQEVKILCIEACGRTKKECCDLMTFGRVAEAENKNQIIAAVQLYTKGKCDRWIEEKRS